MSQSQIRQASIASLLARLHTLSVSSNAEDRAEVVDIQREIHLRLGCGDQGNDHASIAVCRRWNGT
jgi:hypothetical protein